MKICEYLKKSELVESAKKGYAIGFQTLVWRDLIVRIETSKVLQCKTPEDLERLIETQSIVIMELNK